jgi:hypothetical protein
VRVEARRNDVERVPSAMMHSAMAAVPPSRELLDEAIEQMVADDPGLLNRLRAYDRRRRARELEFILIPHEEAMDRLGLNVGGPVKLPLSWSPTACEQTIRAWVLDGAEIALAMEEIVALGHSPGRPVEDTDERYMHVLIRGSSPVPPYGVLYAVNDGAVEVIEIVDHGRRTSPDDD